MSYEVLGSDITLPAGASMSGNQYCFVALNSSGQVVLPASGGVALGVLQNKPQSQAASAAVRVANVSKVIAAGAIAAGALVATDASGHARTLTPEGVENVVVATNAITSAGSAVLNFAAVPAGVVVGMTASDNTAAAGIIPAGATVLSKTSTTVTISANVTGADADGGYGNAVFAAGSVFSR